MSACLFQQSACITAWRDGKNGKRSRRRQRQAVAQTAKQQADFTGEKSKTEGLWNRLI